MIFYALTALVAWFHRYLIQSSKFSVALPCLLFLEWTAPSSFISSAFGDQGLDDSASWTMGSWNSCFDVSTLPYRSCDMLVPRSHRVDKEGSSNSLSWLTSHVSFRSLLPCFCCSFFSLSLLKSLFQFLLLVHLYSSDSLVIRLELLRTHSRILSSLLKTTSVSHLSVFEAHSPESFHRSVCYISHLFLCVKTLII